ELERLRPGALRRRNVALEVLRLPREPFAHGVPCDLLAEARERVALGAVPGALDELHHADLAAAPEDAQRETKGGGRLSLAGAGVPDEQALCDLLLRPLRILPRLALGHLGAVAHSFGIVDWPGHELPLALAGVPLTTSGVPATSKTTQSARAASRWLSAPC